ncbi:AraC family transcriptional regulator [Paenibacillus sp. PL91]|uniref:AraC family transcriptional regulator n=1 Tax=Paenibacillus sp. PL91 TaxID=2729538 RepID=UPI00145C8BD7|nr:AraC family transcriptional regulator [Paenibacillus sp. PL91]MBC9199141.1 helix-turn-helix transcriptional regulator [Paenibacillus sp. PL91]
MKIHKSIDWRDNLYLFNYRRVYTEPVEYFHAHDGLEILYIHEGAGSYSIGNQLYSLKPGTLILIKPFQVHEIKVSVPPDYIRSILKIKTSVIERFLTVLPQLTTAFSQLMERHLPTQVFHLTYKDASYMENHFLQLHESLAIGPLKLQKELVTLFLLHFFTYFNGHIFSLDKSNASIYPASAGSNEPIVAILKWIDRHYRLTFTINDMAAELHFSPNYLSKLFKEQMGVTIIEYTNEKRLEEARTLLAIHFLTIEEISRETGFNYPSYFIALFKKKYGMTPLRYRMWMEY